MFCGQCIAACPRDAIHIEKEKGELLFDRQRCNRCGECVKVCPNGGLRSVGKIITASEVLDEVEKDYFFYKRTGGGISLSGGEPLAQFDFCLELLRQARGRGINTAIETSAFTSKEKIKMIFPYVNIFLIDFKHPDPEAHLYATGVNNESIIENIRYVASLGATTRIRIPLVPSFNDDSFTFERMIEILESIPNLHDIDLIPYHRLGITKYEGLGRPYHLLENKPPSKEKVDAIVNLVRTFSDKLHITVLSS
jgi:pyruvate formate lyase activating enzyme